MQRADKMDSELRRYRSLQLLTDDYNTLFSLFNGIFHATAVALIVFSVYGFVRTEGFMSVLPAYLGIWGTHALYEVMKNEELR